MAVQLLLQQICAVQSAEAQQLPVTQAPAQQVAPAVHWALSVQAWHWWSWQTLPPGQSTLAQQSPGVQVPLQQAEPAAHGRAASQLVHEWLTHGPPLAQSAATQHSAAKQPSLQQRLLGPQLASLLQVRHWLAVQYWVPQSDWAQHAPPRMQSPAQQTLPAPHWALDAQAVQLKWLQSWPVAQKPLFSVGQQSPWTHWPAQQRLAPPGHWPSFWQAPVPVLPVLPVVVAPWVPVVVLAVPVVPVPLEPVLEAVLPALEVPPLAVLAPEVERVAAGRQAPLTHWRLLQSEARVHGPSAAGQPSSESRLSKRRWRAMGPP
jgi:hypothetical protein